MSNINAPVWWCAWPKSVQLARTRVWPGLASTRHATSQRQCPSITHAACNPKWNENNNNTEEDAWTKSITEWMIFSESSLIKSIENSKLKMIQNNFFANNIWTNSLYCQGVVMKVKSIAFLQTTTACKDAMKHYVNFYFHHQRLSYRLFYCPEIHTHSSFLI